MVQSKATSVAAYLAELPIERRQAIEAVREVIREISMPALRKVCSTA